MRSAAAMSSSKCGTRAELKFLVVSGPALGLATGLTSAVCLLTAWGYNIMFARGKIEASILCACIFLGMVRPCVCFVAAQV